MGHLQLDQERTVIEWEIICFIKLSQFYSLTTPAKNSVEFWPGTLEGQSVINDATYLKIYLCNFFKTVANVCL